MTTEQRFWACSMCGLEYEDDGLREANAASVEDAWRGVEETSKPG